MHLGVHGCGQLSPRIYRARGLDARLGRDAGALRSQGQLIQLENFVILDVQTPVLHGKLDRVATVAEAFCRPFLQQARNLA